MRSDSEIPVCVTCYNILCLCEEPQPKRFLTVRKWAKIHGVSMDDLEQAEETLAEIKAQLIALDPEYAKDFAE